MTHICAHPDCNEEGTFPAPRDPMNIYDRQYFCADHIKEFNKRWNGLSGMSEDDVFAMQTKSTWERPTWKFGIEGMSAKTAGFSFEKAEDLYHFFKQRQRDELEEMAKRGRSGAGPGTGSMDGSQHGSGLLELPDDVKEACVILNVVLPLPADKLKKAYLKLVKIHHPDASSETPEYSEEMIKKVNVAYQILKDFMARQG